MRKVLIATVSKGTNTALSKAMSEYEVHICNTGPETLELLETLHPDILVLDLMLPGQTGLTVLQKSSFKPRIILARTNFISTTVLKAAFDVGVQEIILIPCTTQYVVSRLGALMEKTPSPEA